LLDNHAGIEIHGVDHVMPAHCAAPVAMILHELATNAVKHGAWREPGGRVSITWRETPSGDLRLVWAESGVKLVEPLPRKGYGLTIVAGFVEYELGGEVSLKFLENGLVCTFDIPCGESTASRS